jgi:hypothetical protein
MFIFIGLPFQTQLIRIKTVFKEWLEQQKYVHDKYK